jgi:2'-5' RNA ligase
MDFTKTSDYSEAQKASYRRFGYRYMYDAFYPHFTLGRVQSEPSTEQMEWLNQVAQELNLFSPCSITAATIYDMGENGTHARTVLSRALPGFK